MSVCRSFVHATEIVFSVMDLCVRVHHTEMILRVSSPTLSVSSTRLCEEYQNFRSGSSRVIEDSGSEYRAQGRNFIKVFLLLCM